MNTLNTVTLITRNKQQLTLYVAYCTETDVQLTWYMWQNFPALLHSTSASHKTVQGQFSWLHVWPWKALIITNIRYWPDSFLTYTNLSYTITCHILIFHFLFIFLGGSYANVNQWPGHHCLHGKNKSPRAYENIQN